MSLTRFRFRGPIALLAAAQVLCLSCDQEVDKGDDKLTAGRQSMKVLYKESAQTVLFDDLETQYPIDDETPVIFVDDIVLGSGLVTSLDGVWLNFVGEDGFTPIGVCPAEYAPTPGNMAHLGYIERGTTRLIWSAQADFEKCMSVRDVVKIEIADDPSELPLDDPADTDTDTGTEPPDDGVPFESVDVHYGADTHTVAVAGLATATMYDSTVVLVSTLLTAAGITASLDTITVDFEGSDGYRPSQEGRCLDYLPAPGERATRSGVDVATSTLLWDASFSVETCANVKWVAHIYVADR